MSLASWMDEFYPVSANDASATKTELAALRHSLHKWKGLRRKNLEKHRLHKVYGMAMIQQGSHEIMPIDSDSCALCERMFFMSDDCRGCPLARSFQRRSHKSKTHTPCNYNHAYVKWCDTGNPEPMIRALERAIEDLREGRI